MRGMHGGWGLERPGQKGEGGRTPWPGAPDLWDIPQNWITVLLRTPKAASAEVSSFGRPWPLTDVRRLQCFNPGTLGAEPGDFRMQTRGFPGGPGKTCPRVVPGECIFVPGDRPGVCSPVPGDPVFIPGDIPGESQYPGILWQFPGT